MRPDRLATYAMRARRRNRPPLRRHLAEIRQEVGLRNEEAPVALRVIAALRHRHQGINAGLEERAMLVETIERLAS